MNVCDYKCWSLMMIVIIFIGRWITNAFNKSIRQEKVESNCENYVFSKASQATQTKNWKIDKREVRWLIFII